MNYNTINKKQALKKTFTGDAKPSKSEMLDIHELRIAFNLNCNNCIYYDYCKSHKISRNNFVKDFRKH